MRILLFSDLHAHNFKKYATILKNGRNSRLQDSLNIISQIHKISLEQKVDLVLFGGDMFHVRGHISVGVFNSVFEEMSKFLVDRIPVFMLHGNHDQANKDGSDYSLYAFKSFCDVVDKPGWFDVRGKCGNYIRICAIPYMENIEYLKDVINSPPRSLGGELITLFFGHLGIQGASVGANFVYRNINDPSVNDLSISNFDIGFLGHYHLHQKINNTENFWYIGAPMHHNWGDSHDVGRGCIIYDTQVGYFKRFKLKYPKFIEMDCRKFNVDLLFNNYIRVKGKFEIGIKDLEDIKNEYKPRSFEIIDNTEQNKLSRNISFDEFGYKYQQFVEEYVKNNLNGLDMGYLMSLGKDILEELEE